ncbi:MAG: VWA domain-containing protein [Methylomonas lenta]|nr:VWA domain-containing protein [Methylomonas lenta]
MLADFHFLRPWWLLALLPAAALLILLIKNKTNRGDWATVCDTELLPFILQEKPLQTHASDWVTAALAILLSILALAGPTWERLPGPAFRNESALVIALDLSKSMDATDLKPSRISRARYKISDILKQRKDGQTALIVYSGDAFIVTPLTTDTDTINSQLEALNTDIMPSPGSNTGVAIEKAVDLLHQAGLAQGYILLVTDGVDQDSAAEASRILGDYRLSVLAMGTTEGAPIPIANGGFLKDNNGNIVVARLNPAELSDLAAAGHGIYQPATANDTDVERLNNVFNKAVNSKNSEQTDSLLQQWDEKGPWLLLLVLPWAALRFRKGLLTFALICLLPLPQNAEALDWQSFWETKDQRAQQAFQQQQYDQAAEAFENPDWRAAAQYKAGHYQEAAETLKDAKTADGQYNRGNALAKAGQLQEALKEYQEALKLNPNNEDAKSNYETTKKELEKQEKQQKENRQPCTETEQAQNPDCKDTEKQEPSEDGKNKQSDESDQKNQEQGQDQDQQQQEGGKPADNKQDSQKNQQKQPEPEQQTDQPQDANQTPKPAKPEQPQSSETEKAQRTASEQNEIQRANDQLLKRIPDEPTGLLKRKFKYQYGQRDPPPHNGPNW